MIRLALHCFLVPLILRALDAPDARVCRLSREMGGEGDD